MRLALRLENGALGLAGERRVIKAHEVEALRDHKRLLEEARQEAETIVGSANEAYEAERQRGYQEGRQSGKGEIAERLVELAEQNAHLMAGLEAKVPEIVMSALRQILGEYDNFDLALQSVKHALKIFHKQTDVTLRVAPQHFAEMRAKVDELKAENESVTYLDVVADRDMAPGDCILETALGNVDAGIEAQLAVIERAMRNDMSSQSEAGGGAGG